MAGYFQIGEKKIRPGSYFNVQKKGEENAFGAVDGIVAVLFRSTFGPLGEVVCIDRDDGYETIFGLGGTTDAMREAICGGAKKIIACRLGTGGSAATASLTAATGSVTIKAKHVGKMDFSVTVREKLVDSTRKECIIYAGTQEYEKINFTAGGDEAASLVEAFKNSKAFTATLEGSAEGILETVAQAAFTAGTDPTVKAEDYSNALSQVEKHYFNTICVDTEDKAIHELVSAFLDRIYEAGQFGIGVVAEKHTMDLEERIATAKGFDKENMVYVLNAHVQAKETELDGYQTAAMVAGMIAANPCKQSLTHMQIERYSTLNEGLTNTQIIKAEQQGCLVLSYDTNDKVWVDSGINTLIHPADNKDEGWKKIRRVRTRYELMYRANAQADALVGKVDNDINGRATIIGKIQKICNDMMDEGKIMEATVTESSEYKADTDSCWFVIDVIDKDSAEHIYLFYRFQFSTNE